MHRPGTPAIPRALPTAAMRQYWHIAVAALPTTGESGWRRALYPAPASFGCICNGTVQRSGGSCRFGKGQIDIGDPIKSMPKPSTERSVVDRATNLQQQIGAF